MAAGGSVIVPSRREGRITELYATRVRTGARLMASRWDETNIMYAAHPGALAPAFARACCMISEDICVLPAGHPCQID